MYPLVKKKSGLKVVLSGPIHRISTVSFWKNVARLKVVGNAWKHSKFIKMSFIYLLFIKPVLLAHWVCWAAWFSRLHSRPSTPYIVRNEPDRLHRREFVSVEACRATIRFLPTETFASSAEWIHSNYSSWKVDSSLFAVKENCTVNRTLQYKSADEVKPYNYFFVGKILSDFRCFVSVSSEGNIWNTTKYNSFVIQSCKSISTNEQSDKINYAM